MRSQSAYFVCTDIRVRDLSRAVRFYRALGLRPIGTARMRDGTSLVWMQDPTSRQLLELFRLSPRSRLYTRYRPQSEASSSRIFSVADVGPILRRLRRMGHREHLAFEDGNVRLTFLRDPDGAVIELVSWTEKARPSRRAAPMFELITARRTRARAGTSPARTRAPSRRAR
ncbi:MAG TPA: VOC family protein [Thermoplasmata archaeon]|nr:VOC family protein [Thermoplasmata archaeon]